MYSVIVVDDEIISRLGISSLIEWESQEFSLVDTLTNGQEALEFIRNQHVDLVITDIKMPVMTGIELIKAAKEEGIKSQFVVLSSYDDYTYVREALKLGALDYILKLDLDQEHIKTVLSRAKEQIESQSSSIAPGTSFDKQTLNSARRDFLKQLLYGRVVFDENINNRLNHLKMEFTEDMFVTLMFKVDNLDELPAEGGIRSVIDEVLVDYEPAFVCHTGYDELSILYNLPHKGEQEMLKSVQHLASRISYIMKQYFDQKVVIYASQLEGKLEDVPLTYLQVCQAHSYKSVISEASLVFFKDVIQRRSARDFKSFEAFLSEFGSALQIKNYEEVNTIFDELFTYVNSTKYIEVGQISYFLFSLIYLVDEHMKVHNLTIHSIWGSEEERYDRLQTLVRKDDFLVLLNEIRESIKLIEVDAGDNYIIRNVKKYLNEHYKEGVVLKEVSDHFGLTNTYLSMLFKRETGDTLKSYLTNLKIGRAQELLKNSGMRVSEIAMEIGYEDEHYFSRIFKQKTTMTPTQYRNNG